MVRGLDPVLPPSVSPPDSGRRLEARRCALGESPADLLLSGGTVFNGVTGEFLPGLNIWVKEGLIAYVGPELPSGPAAEIPLGGRVVVPGLMDTHTHPLGFVRLEQFVEHVVPSGVTTAILETDDLPRIVGTAGYRELARQAAAQPLRLFYTTSPLGGLTLEEELMVPEWEEIASLFTDPRCLGVGEVYWSNLLLPGRQGERLRRLIDAALAAGLLVEGHTAGAGGRKLQAYVAEGISSCHEPITAEEVADRLRLGLWVLLRQGGVRKELEGASGVFNLPLDFRRLALSTDGQHPQGFLDEGYLDAAVREALRRGVPPRIVYQMVTINAAEHFRLDGMLGLIAPGRYADLVVIPSPGDYRPELILCEGRILYEAGGRRARPAGMDFPEAFYHTMDVGLPGPAETAWPVDPIAVGGRLRCLEYVSRLVTKEAVLEAGGAEAATARALLTGEPPLGSPGSINLLLAADRLAARGAFLGLAKGYGLQQGAVGSSMCWDTGDVLALGCDRASLRTVVARLRETGGGAVYARGDQVVAELQSPICGLVSEGSMREVAESMGGLGDVLAQAGVPWENPVLSLITLATPAIPHFRVTHRGYVRLKDRAVLGVAVG